MTKNDETKLIFFMDKYRGKVEYCATFYKMKKDKKNCLQKAP